MHNLGYFMYYTHSWLNNSILKLCFEETNIIKIWRQFVDLKGQFLLKPPYCHLLCWPMMKIFVSVFTRVLPYVLWLRQFICDTCTSSSLTKLCLVIVDTAAKYFPMRTCRSFLVRFVVVRTLYSLHQ